MTAQPTRPAPPDLTRRRLLGMAGISGVAVLAACADDSSTGTESSDPPTTLAVTAAKEEPLTAPLVQRFIDEAWNEGSLDVLDEIFEYPYTVNSLNIGPPPMPPMDAAALRDHVMTFRTAFPDLKLTTEQVVEQEGSAFVQARLTGTNTGSFMGLAPSGGKADFVLSAVYHAKDGKLTSHDVLVDLMGLFHQIGLLPDLFTIATGGAMPGR